MQPHIVSAAVGDNPPKAHLYYGITAIEGLRLLPANSVHMICCSPPYWRLRDYGTEPHWWGGQPGCAHEITDSHQCKSCDAWFGSLGLEPTPALFARHIVLIFDEVRRVLHPKGTAWLNLGDSYMSHIGDIRLVGGSEGSRQAKDAGYRSNALVGKPHVRGLKNKDLVGIPWRVALALQDAGWYLRNDIIWHKANTMPNPVNDRLVTRHEHVFLLAPNDRYYFDLDAIRERHAYGSYDDNGEFTPAQNWFTDPDDRKYQEDGKHLADLGGSPRKPVASKAMYHDKGKNPGDVWPVPAYPYGGAHFATWPPALVERFIKAGSSERGCCPQCKTPWARYREGKRVGMAPSVNINGWGPLCDCEDHEPERCVVMDIFSGSGTTGQKALELNRDYIGLDLNVDYLDLAKARITGQAAPKQAADEDNAIGDLFE